jgi:hypothetical protein
MCVEEFEQCGGNNMTTTSCCDGRCVVKNFFYAQCLTRERAAKNVEEQGWDGRVLACGEDVPLDAPKGPEDPAMVAAAPSRRLSQVGTLCLQAHSFVIWHNVGTVLPACQCRMSAMRSEGIWTCLTTTSFEPSLVKNVGAVLVVSDIAVVDLHCCKNPTCM